MRILTYIIPALLLLSSCIDLENGNPYAEDMHRLSISLQLPPDYQGLDLSGINVEIRDNANGVTYNGISDNTGTIRLDVLNGVYSATLAATISYEQFNASLSGIIVDGTDCNAVMNLLHSRTGDIVIKEIYCGGCLKLPAQGNYHIAS